jgi:HK97 family phage portal protein
MNKEIRILGLKIWERREYAGTLMDPSERLITALGGSVTDAGVTVNGNNITTLSAVWRAVNIISGTLAALPLKLYKATGDNRESLHDNKLQLLIKNPNRLMTDFIFRETTQAQLMLWGNAYAVIQRNEKGEPIELLPIHPDDVMVEKFEGQLRYNVTIDNRTIRILQPDMIHVPGLGFDGLKGKSVIHTARESMGLTLAAQNFGAKFFSNGANMDGVLEVPGTLTDDVYDRLRSSWNEKYKGVKNAHETAILEGGMKYNRISIPPEDAQFLQTRQFQVAEIARWFGVQPHLLMDLDRATNNNIEHQGMEFVTFTLQPWVKRWEAELNRKLLNKEKRSDHYFEYNLNGLLRGDSKARAEYYRGLYSIGAMTPNEIRKLENQPAYPGGDTYFTQAGFAPVSVLEQYYLSKQKQNGTKE